MAQKSTLPLAEHTPVLSLWGIQDLGIYRTVPFHLDGSTFIQTFLLKTVEPESPI
jgi:hypothetical protein